MSGLGPPFGRRAFLASGVGLSAGVVAADALDARAAVGTVAGQRRVGSAAAATATSSSLHAASLTVNGLVDPVGVDPDDCSFAWTLTAAGRDNSRREPDARGQEGPAPERRPGPAHPMLRIMPVVASL